MPKRAPVLIDKPLALRLWELCDSLRLVRDAQEQLQVGKAHYFLALAGQLRLLLTDRSKGITPLLFDIAKLMQRELRVFHGRTLRSDEELRASGVEPEPLLFALAGFPVGLTKEFPEQIESQLDRFLRLPIVRVGDQTYSTAHLIDFFANSAGGAHSPGSWSKELAGLYNLRLGAYPALVTALRQIADAVLVVGKDMVGELASFEVHLALVVSDVPTDRTVTLMSVFDNETRASINLVLDPYGRLLARLQSIHGMTAGVVVGGVDWRRAHHIALFTRLTRRLETELILVVDDEHGSEEILDAPFLMPMERKGLEILINRTAEDAEAGTTLGVVEVMVFHALQGYYERAERVRDLKTALDDPATPASLLQRGACLHAQVGGAIQSYGSIVSSTVGDLLRPVTEEE